MARGRAWIAGMLAGLAMIPAQPAHADTLSPTYLYVAGVAGGAIAQRYTALIEKAATKWRLDPLLVARVVRLESSFNPREVSETGAIGLMQVMPYHFTQHRVPRAKRMDPATNLDLGCRVLKWYLSVMEAKYPGLDSEATLRRALVAYNMGPKAVVTRGIYRSRYSDIILTRYQMPGMDEASGSLAAETRSAEVPFPAEAPQTASTAWVDAPNRSAELPSLPGPELYGPDRPASASVAAPSPESP